MTRRRNTSALAPRGGPAPAFRKALAYPQVVQVVDKPVAAAPPVAERDAVEEARAWEVILGAAAIVPMPSGAEGPPPAVTIDASRAEPTLLAAYYDDIVGDCLERLAMLGRHRLERPFADRARIEQRALAQIDGLIEAGGTLERIVAWWELASSDDGDEAGDACWAAVLTLAMIDGGASLTAIGDLIELLPPDVPEDTLHPDAQSLVARLGDALVVSPHPHRDALVADLLESPHPVARAVGVEVSARTGRWPSEQLLAELSRDEAPILDAALRALSRSPDAEVARAAAPRLRALLAHAHDEVVWQAARAAVLLGQRGPYFEVRQLGALAGRLGEHAVELMAMVGEVDDYAVVARLLGQLPATPTLLDRAARFGHPAVADYLLRHLSEGDLADEAAAALCTLFGALVPDPHPSRAAAWRDAVAGAALSCSERHRRGSPWSERAVVAECRSLELSQRAVEHRIDALQARSGRPRQLELAPFGVDLRAMIA